MDGEDNDRFIFSSQLYVDEHAEKILNARFNVAHHIYNSFLGECEKRRKMMQSKNKRIFADKISEKEKKDLYEKSRNDAGFYLRSASKYGKINSLEDFALRTTSNTWIDKHIDSHTRLKLMGRAFLACETAMKNRRKGKNARVRFKKFGVNHITSLEDSSKKSPIKVKLNDKGEPLFKVGR